MPAFADIFVHKKLQPIEEEQLLGKGYLKLKIEFSLEHLRLFQAEYLIGDHFIFYTSKNTEITTLVTSIDTGEPHGEIYRVFIGFALVLK